MKASFIIIVLASVIFCSMKVADMGQKVVSEIKSKQEMALNIR